MVADQVPGTIRTDRETSRETNIAVSITPSTQAPSQQERASPVKGIGMCTVVLEFRSACIADVVVVVAPHSSLQK